MSKGSKIHKRFGLKLALAYRLRKTQKRIESKPFIQQLKMFGLLCKSNIPNKFEIYSLLRKQNYLMTSLGHLEFIALYYKDIIEWLESKEYQEQYLNTNHP
ncbi:hypothetical protein LS70_009365 [Helicobacter sp. MIT 11-5569]|uniref:hypothetical protein n=1 Tax=Helicobacter sp. MIT 11-5569 TaxID=1548151 RepID=UPI00051FCACE|nr:hypothetical protein [Helicobacter sp. MIT 11-5569]TLD80040.1 hypothetical protein LS70_009365 [Helicobacter sp. MIT 11-5569]